MSTTSAAPPVARFPVRYVQMSRAGIAAVAAIMITFSPDHSASVGLSVFSGFGIASALILFLAAWLTYPAGRRWAPILIGVLSLIAGMVAGIVGLRSTALLFAVVISWAVATGIAELVWGIRERRHADVARADARDTLVVGGITLVLAIAFALVPQGYSLDYFIADAGPAGETFTLTGVTIAVGIFGAYAAIIAVFLGIAAFSPRRDAVEVPVVQAGADAL